MQLAQLEQRLLEQLTIGQRRQHLIDALHQATRLLLRLHQLCGQMLLLAHGHLVIFQRRFLFHDQLFLARRLLLLSLRLLFVFGETPGLELLTTLALELAFALPT